MAEGTAPEAVEPNTGAATVGMDVEDVESAQGVGEPIDGVDSAPNGESNQKRAREEEESHEDNDGVSKKQKVDQDEEKSVEEEPLEKLEEPDKEEEEAEEAKEERVEKKSSGPVKLGPKSFGSSLEIFNYFYKFLRAWPPYLNVNKYEHIMLLELLKHGHAEPDKKIGGGIRAFQVRNHPMWKNRCFFLIREDGSVDDFSFRKCVDHILPLPEEMHLKSDVNKALGGGGGGRGGKRPGGKGGSGRGGRGGGRGRGRCHGRGGRWRH